MIVKVATGMGDAEFPVPFAAEAHSFAKQMGRICNCDITIYSGDGRKAVVSRQSWYNGYVQYGKIGD